jgi:HlyD family secretion protein
MTDPFLPTAAAPATTGASMDRKRPPSRLARLRRWRWALLVPLIALAAVLALRFTPAAGTLAVNTADLAFGTAAEAPFQDYLPVRATVAPLHSVFVDAIEGGQVASVVVTDGATVTQGQVLAVLSNPQLQLDVSSRAAAVTGQLGSASAQLLALQQSLATERGAIAQAGYDLLKAQRDLSVRAELHRQGFESDAGVKTFSEAAQYYAQRIAMLRQAYAHDQALAERQTQQIDQTEALLRANLATVQSSLAALTERAPVAGRLTNFTLQPGQTLRQGDALGQIDSTHAFRLDADIDEFYLGRIDRGQAATANVEGNPVRLRVARVRPQVTQGQFRAELTFVGAPPAGLQRGQTTDVRITLGATQSALVVPNGAWLSSSGGQYIFVVDADGRHARRVAITVGRRNPEQVEITAGLSPGTRVIVSSYTNFNDFQRLLLQEGSNS